MRIVDTNSETKLTETVSALQHRCENHYAIHYHLSLMEEHFRSPYQIRIAVNVLKDVFKSDEGTIYILKGGDLVVLYHGSNRGLLEQAIFQLRYLFMDDPLAYTDDGYENEHFCTVHDLEFHWRDFYEACKSLVARQTIKTAPQSTGTQLVSASGERKKLHMLTPAYLIDVLATLETTDIKRAFRSQPICAVAKGKAPKEVFKETYVNIRALQDLLRTDVDLLSNKPLFKYITRKLDHKTLSLFESGLSPHVSLPVSINLNIATLVSDAFSHINDLIPKASRSKMMIEINVVDVFDDIATFMSVKEAVQKAGYRICIDGLDYVTFTQIDRLGLGFDLAKLRWTPQMRDDTNQERRDRLTAAITRCGANRMILCWCDDKAAIDYGQSIGVSLFQGRYLDQLINPRARVIN